LQLEIFLPQELQQQMKSKMAGTMLSTELTINSAGGEISLVLSLTLDNGITLTDGAPQKWALVFPGNDLLSSLVFSFRTFKYYSIHVRCFWYQSSNPAYSVDVMYTLCHCHLICHHNSPAV
jgi:hypothetical protein